MGLAEILKHLPRLLRLRTDLVARLLAARPDVVRRHRLARIQPARRRATEGPGRADRAVRQSAGLGVAAGPRAHDRPVRRPRAVRAAVRKPLLRRALTCARCSWGTRWPTACRSNRPPGRRAPRWGCRPDAPIVAVLPGSRRGEVGKLGAAVRRDDRVAACAAAGAAVRRADGECARARHVRTQPGAARARRAGAPGRRTRAGGDHRRRRRAGRLRHGHARDRAGQAADGRRLSRGAADELAAARPQAHEGRISSRSRTCSPGRRLVPEYFQEEVRPEVLGPALLEQLERPDRAELDRHVHRNAPRRCAATRAHAPRRRSSNCVAQRRQRGMKTRRSTAGDARSAQGRAHGRASTKPAAGRSRARSSRPP